ncbi:MAG: ATP-binding cassette family protein, partial [Hymenobacteraceae bacterium]|nr:ATP-binding cassette family protein [Hymenobacteraceae bacterium]
LEQQAQAQPVVLARYERLLELAQQRRHQQQKLQGITEQLQQFEQEARTLKAQEESVQQKYAAAAERLEDLQKLVQLQQKIQQYEEARHTLKPEEPCPLCGSQHHPFVEDSYSFDLPEDVQKRDTQQALVKELEQHMHQLQLQQNTLTQKQNTSVAAKSEAEAEISRLRQTFVQVAAGIDEKVGIADATAIQELLQVQQQATSALQQLLAQARSLNRELEGINQQLQSLREAQVKAEAKHNQLQASEQLLRAQLQKLQTALADEQEQHQVHTETAVSFAATFASTYNPEARQELLQALEQQAMAYTQKKEALEQMREQYITSKEQVKNLNLAVEEKAKELKDRQEALVQTHQQLNELKTKRQHLFGEKDPEQERRQAQQELRARATQAEEARARHMQKQQELHEAKQRHTEYSTAQQKSKSVLDELRDGLLQVLRQKGIETIETLSQMLLNRDEADRLANLKAQTEKHLTELRKSLSDVTQELAQAQAKRLTEEKAEELQKVKDEKTQQQRELIAQRARYQQLLEQDAQQREKNKELAGQLQVQQQTCNRWSQLSDLIGSADGNKFSRFAQGLTLARLVELANRHLQKLNDRYRIQKSSEEDLELLIVDTYQAEAIRPMNTLSGGESFLVSLALALGLSDLAGRRTQINSLFIDEGFGTLDADTLDAAVSTLENLQASGKMIGIISHVEALKERISTQIKVKKQAGGVSKVEVVGW